MGTLTPYRQSAVAKPQQSLPGTTADPGMPMPVEAQKHIVTNLLGPVLLTFAGGAAPRAEEIEALYRLWTPLLSGFEPEAYEMAARMMMLERKDRFRPVPAEIRDYLEKAEKQHYEAGGEARKSVTLKLWLKMLLMHGFGSWRPNYGPAPGQPGCRLSETDIASELRKYLSYEYEATGDGPSWRHQPHLLHRRRKRVMEVLGLDMTAHPTFRAVLVELGIPHTPEDCSAADMAIAVWDMQDAKDRLQSAIRRRGSYWDEGERKRRQVEVDAARTRCDEAERAVAAAEGRDLAAWDAERAAKRKAEESDEEAEHQAAQE